MEYRYITIGHPSSRMPILPLVVVAGMSEKGLREEAKKLRKTVAENAGHYGFRTSEAVVNFKPSELYWAVFDTKEYDAKPVLHSDNYYWGVLGKDVLSKQNGES